MLVQVLGAPNFLKVYSTPQPYSKGWTLTWLPVSPTGVLFLFLFIQVPLSSMISSFMKAKAPNLYSGLASRMHPTYLVVDVASYNYLMQLQWLLPGH